MKILLPTDTIGGVWTYAIELARALRPHDVQIALATMGDPLSLDQWRQVAALDHVTVFQSRYKLEWMPNPWDDVRDAGNWLLEIEQRFAPDLVHLNGYAHGSLPWHAPVLVAAHSCVLSWWQAVKHEPAPPQWDRYRRVVREGFRAADMIIAPTAAMLAAVEHHYGPLPAPSRVIHNGRDASLFHATKKEPFILAAGRLWDEAKNVASLGRIAPYLSWPVYVAGESNDHLPRNVHALGRLDPSTLAAWMARAAVYALPARYEPFGLSILEAALSGCALVLGDIPSLRENWEGAALFVGPDDTGALEAALLHLAGNQHRRRCLAAKARERAV